MSTTAAGDVYNIVLKPNRLKTQKDLKTVMSFVLVLRSWEAQSFCKHQLTNSGTTGPTIWYPSLHSALNITANIGKRLYFRRTDKIMKSPLIYRKPL